MEKDVIVQTEKFELDPKVPTIHCSIFPPNDNSFSYSSLSLENHLLTFDTESNRIEPNPTESNRIEPNPTESNRTEPNRTELNRIDAISIFSFRIPIEIPRRREF